MSAKQKPMLDAERAGLLGAVSGHWRRMATLTRDGKVRALAKRGDMTLTAIAEEVGEIDRRMVGVIIKRDAVLIQQARAGKPVTPDDAVKHSMTLMRRACGKTRENMRAVAAMGEAA